MLIRVNDDAMAAAGIAAGDWLVVSEYEDAGNGAAVAVMHNGDAIVRTLERGPDGTVRFTAPGQGRQPVPGEQADIIGPVTAVIRRAGQRTPSHGPLPAGPPESS